MSFTVWGIILAIVGIVAYEVYKGNHSNGRGSVSFSSSGQGYTG